MLRSLRQRSNRTLVGIIGLALALVFALRGVALAGSGVPQANNQQTICVGSAVITIAGQGESRTVAIERCDDGLFVKAAILPSAAADPAPAQFHLHSWTGRGPLFAPAQGRPTHPARGPPRI